MITPRFTPGRIGRRLAGGRARRGFTFVELMVALTLGVVIVSAAIGYLLRELRTLTGSDLRLALSRNGRYVSVSLRHDLHKAGIGVKSTTTFGTLDTWAGNWGDTLVVLYVPYLPEPAPPHALFPAPGPGNPLPPGGTCGARCLDLKKDPVKALELEVGDLARLEVPGERRLIIVEDLVVTSDTTFQLRFTDATTILRQPAALSGGLLLDRFATYVQKLTPILYYLDGQEQLQRAERLNLNGSPNGDVLAYGVERFDVKLVFGDGDELDLADPADADVTNDFDDIVAARIRVDLKADRIDPRVNGGQLLRKGFEFNVAPRNLRYEKFRL